MKIAFRVDASIQIGSGHVMRCLTLADALRERGGNVFFITREHEGSLNDLISAKGYGLCRLPPPPVQCHKLDGNRNAEWLGVSYVQDARETSSALRCLAVTCNWLVVDHYALNHRWEEIMRPMTDKIVVIDDLADRQHDCDLLLNQNLYEEKNSRYENHIPSFCRLITGPRYALLRSEFLKERQRLKKHDGIIRRIFVFFGGTDQNNETEKALGAIDKLGRKDLSVDAVIGANNPNRDAILGKADQMHNVACHENVENMARLMARADIAIGAGGTTTWERCCLGLPALVLVLADNQTDVAASIEQYNAGKNLGLSKDISADSLTEALDEMLHSPEKVAEYSKAAFELVDGKGAARVAKIMQFGRIFLREANSSDGELLWQWANDQEVRQNAFRSEFIPWEEHIRWFETKLYASQCIIFIAENDKGLPVGQIRFDISADIADIDYSVNRQFRGLGIGHYILQKGIKRISRYFDKPLIFQGRVKSDNDASKRCFTKARFSNIGNPNLIIKPDAETACIQVYQLHHFKENN